MEDAITAILDFRDILDVEVAAQAPDISSFYGVRLQPQTGLHGNTSNCWCYCSTCRFLMDTVVQMLPTMPKITCLPFLLVTYKQIICSKQICTKPW